MPEKLKDNEDIAFYGLLYKFENKSYLTVQEISRILQYAVVRCIDQSANEATPIISLDTDAMHYMGELIRFFKIDQTRRSVLEALLNLYKTGTIPPEKENKNSNYYRPLRSLMYVDEILENRTIFYELQEAGIPIIKEIWHGKREFKGQIGEYRFDRCEDAYSILGLKVPYVIAKELYDHQKNLQLRERSKLEDPSKHFVVAQNRPLESQDILGNKLIECWGNVYVYTESALKIAADRLKSYDEKLKKAQKDLQKPRLRLVKS